MINQQLSDAKIDPNSITDIVILGGRNDMYHLNTSSSSDIISSHATACKNLNAWLKTKYPKAKVFWGINSFRPPHRFTLRGSVYRFGNYIICVEQA